ncbi:MAG: SDR family oxidoreductase [Chloroflexi bacterium]|nr:SDR family oxidoreductase [Chloroflexota bacterium]MCL5273856.1 SDR family oxidoreductase [Chloroflexota bacterium]
MFLSGRVAIVTGASKEIGAAMAEALAQAGAAVVVHYAADSEQAESVVRRIRAAGGKAIAAGADCSRVGDNTALVKTALDAFGRVDIFVANAGITRFGRFLDYTEEAFDTVVGLNLKGSYFGAQAAARQMVAQRAANPGDTYGGRIVFSSSVAGVTGVIGLSAYGSTKAAINFMTEVLALELGPHGITVNALGIGSTVNARNLREDPLYAEHWAEILPIHRALTPQDSAAALMYLVSPAASAVTGATLMVDGGQYTQCRVPPAEEARSQSK